MLKGLRYITATLVVVVLAAMARNDLASIRMLASDTSFFTTQLAEVTRLEKEMLQFRVNAASLVRGVPGVSREDMLLSFDLLWSRVNTELTRFVDPKIDALRHHRGTLASLSAGLKVVDPLIQSLKPGDENALAGIESVMNASAPGISSMNSAAYFELYARSTDAALRQHEALRGLDRVQIVTMMIGFAMVIALFWQLRKGERLYGELQAREGEIRALATLDPLTGLSNRRCFDERMQAIDSGEWNGSLHLLLVDLDGFKQVNDRIGHGAGDHLLRVIARRLPLAAGHNALIARLGGDEFALVVTGTADDAGGIAATVIREISRPVLLGAATLQVGASVGVSTLRGGHAPSTTLQREADAALYHAKAKGKGRALHFDETGLQTQSAA